MMLLKLLLPLLLLEACVPTAKKSNDTEAPGLLISGNLESEEELGETRIFINNDANPIARAIGSSFEFSISNEKLQDLRHANGGQDGPLRLYFYTKDDERVAVSSDLKLTNRGRMTTGVLELLPEVTLTGTVSTEDSVDGRAAYVKEALVTVGRNCANTNADGDFELKAPQQANLPLVVERKEFVRSEGTWLTDNLDSARNLRLYKTLAPVGQIEINDIPRTTRAKVRLMVSGNAMSRFVRMSVTKSDLQGTASAGAPWLSLDDALVLPSDFLNQSQLYYQFADESRTALGPIVTLTPPQVN